MWTSTSTDSAVPLGGWDLATWRAATAHPLFRAPLVALLRLDGDPGRAELLERVARVVPDSLLARRIDVVDGRPYVREVAVDVERHVVDWQAEADPLAELVEDAHALIPEDAPPWCIARFPGRPSHLALVMDHALADGRTALAMAAGLLDGWQPPVYAEPAGRGPELPELGVRSGLEQAISVGRSLLRLTRVHDRPLSPVLRARGGSQSWHTLEFPLDVLRGSARSAGITVNDALVAAVLRAVGAYHDRQGSAVAELRVNIPISLRGRDAARGNSLAVARATLPIPDGPASLYEIHDRLLAWRTEPALAHVDRLVGAGNLLPVPMLAAVARASDLTISNLGPVPGRATIAGQRVQAVFPLPGTMGVAVSVALLSYGATGCVGIALDDAAITDADLMIELIAAQLGTQPARRGGGGGGGGPA